MKKIFMIYAGADKQYAEQFCSFLQQDTANHIEILEHRRDHDSNTPWKPRIKEQIREANVVIFIQGANAADSRNVRWEVKTALSLKKPLAVAQRNTDSLPKWLNRKKTAKLYQWNDIDKLKKELVLLDTKRYNIFSNDVYEILEDRPAETVQQLFEQYKLYQQTTEELENRKQNANNFYLTLNEVLLAFCGAIFGWANASEVKVFLILCVVAASGIIFNLSWCNQIERFKIINTAKLRLINSVERQLPLRLYDEEYRIMNNDLNDWKYRNTFKDEKRIPHAFIGVYIILFLIFLAFFGFAIYQFFSASAAVLPVN